MGIQPAESYFRHYLVRMLILHAKASIEKRLPMG